MRFIVGFLTSLFLGTSSGHALPVCKGSPTTNVGTFLQWSDCNGTWSNNVVSLTAEIKNGAANGYGTWSHARGDKYIGLLKDSLPHGMGIMYYPNGEINEGVWKAGQFAYAKKTPYSNNRSQPQLLRSAIKVLDRSEVRLIQSKLRDLDLYRSSIDGVYGSQTAKALNAYNNIYLGGLDLSKKQAIVRLIAEVVMHDTDELHAENINKKKRQGKTIQKPTIGPKKDDRPLDEIRKVASGTGFYVSEFGHIITNNHVIDGCEQTKVHIDGKQLDTVQIAFDAKNDLALLKADVKPNHVFALSPKAAFPIQDILVAGFPFGNRVSSTLKFTKGIVSSTAGIGNNYSEIQIDAALQPGNSGGPIIDEFGNIIGVAVSKLDMKKILKDFGVIPENTNFGIKASVVKNLMQGNALKSREPSTVVVPKSELSKSVTNGTVYLTCWMTTEQIQELKGRKVMFNEFED